jgi:LysM repeat protein
LVTGKQMVLVIVVNALISALISLTIVIVVVLPAVDEVRVSQPAPTTVAMVTQAPPVNETETVPEPVIHVVEAGDTISGLALRYGVAAEDIAAANRLENPNFLREGNELIIPVGGVPQVTATIAAVPTATETPLPFDPPSALTATAIAQASATALPPIPTLPMQGELEVEITGVIGAQDLSQERVIITNVGDQFADMAGWVLSDTDGNSYTFAGFRLWPGGNVAVYTRGGQDGNPPASFFWGKQNGVWSAGDVATLADAGGNVIATHELGP